jgi:hypothetical protein
MLEAPLYQQGNTYPARLDRQFIEDVFDVEGVIKPATGALKASPRADGANMSVDIAAGRAVIRGDDEANQGHYRVISTAVENLPVGAAPGSDSRIDLVVARVRDAAVTGGVSSDWLLEVIPGAVAASPAAPALPPTAIPIAEVRVAAGTTSIDAAKITDRRPTAANAAYVANALVDAKGDLLVGSASDTLARLAAGANGRVLKADSAAAAGLAWADAVTALEAFVRSDETTTSTAYADLATVGPSVPFPPAPASGRVLIMWSVGMYEGGGNPCFASPTLFDGTLKVGAATDAHDDRSAMGISTAAAAPRGGGLVVYSGLVPGHANYSVRLQYRTVAGTGHFAYRRLIVIPL